MRAGSYVDTPVRVPVMPGIRGLSCLSDEPSILLQILHSTQAVGADYAMAAACCIIYAAGGLPYCSVMIKLLVRMREVVAELQGAKRSSKSSVQQYPL